MECSDALAVYLYYLTKMITMFRLVLKLIGQPIVMQDEIKYHFSITDQDIQAIEKGKKDFENGKTITMEDLKRELGI